MTEHDRKKRPSLVAPLICIAAAAAITVLGFGLCSRNYAVNNRLGEIGADLFFAGAAGVAAGLFWLVVAAIIRVVRANRR